MSCYFMDGSAPSAHNNHLVNWHTLFVNLWIVVCQEHRTASLFEFFQIPRGICFAEQVPLSNFHLKSEGTPMLFHRW